MRTISGSYGLDLIAACESVLAKYYCRLPFLHEREIHAYCVGLPRSGTHSISNMFSKHYASYHEPASRHTIIHLLKWLKGKYSNPKIETVLRARDSYLQLEMEASHFLHYTTKILVKIFPKANFILTIRDPYTWLISEINQNFITQTHPEWRALEEYRYAHYKFGSEKEEASLAGFNHIYPLSCYLSYWRDHIQKVMSEVPADRLLIIRTDKIRDSVPELANFLGIDLATINVKESHSGRSPRRYLNYTKYISQDYAIQKIIAHCGELLEKYFPDLEQIAETWGV